jgi:cytidine deaminase
MEVTDARLYEMRQKRTKHSTLIPKKHNPETFRITALVVGSSGEVYGWGYNHMGPNTPMTIHAERDAINKATRKLLAKGARLRRRIIADLYVMRDNGMNSKPCYNCITESIYNNRYFNFRHIHYSHEDSPTGFVTMSSNQLYDTRWSYISSANVRRMTKNGTLVEDPTATRSPTTAHDREYCRKCTNGDCNRHHQRVTRSSPKSQSASASTPNGMPSSKAQVSPCDKAFDLCSALSDQSTSTTTTVVIYRKVSTPLGRFS